LTISFYFARKNKDMNKEIKEATLLLDSISDRQDIRLKNAEQILKELSCLGGLGDDFIVKNGCKPRTGAVWMEYIRVLPFEVYNQPNINWESKDSQLFIEWEKRITSHTVLVYWPVVLNFIFWLVQLDRTLTSYFVSDVRTEIIRFLLPDANGLRERPKSVILPKTEPSPQIQNSPKTNPTSTPIAKVGDQVGEQVGFEAAYYQILAEGDEPAESDDDEPPSPGAVRGGEVFSAKDLQTSTT
jgi:hypothetical protein